MAKVTACIEIQLYDSSRPRVRHLPLPKTHRALAGLHRKFRAHHVLLGIFFVFPWASTAG